MTARNITPPYPVFLDRDGTPLDNGFVFIGVENLEPVENPLDVYWDEALTIPASQPIRTINGYPSRSGTPSAVFADDVYSISVRDSKGLIVYTSLNQNDILRADLISVVQPFTGAKPTNQGEFNSRYACIFDFMTPEEIADVKSGARALDHTAAMQAAMDWGHQNHSGRMMAIHCPAGRYNFSQLHGKMHVRFWGDGEGTSHSNAAIGLGFQTEFFQIAGTNDNFIYYDVNSSDDPGELDSNTIADIGWERISFRGNYTGPGDVTNTVGSCIFFDDVTPIQGVNIRDLIIHNFPEDAIRATRHFLPATLTNIWGKYVRYVLHVTTNTAGRITHMFNADRIQGDFLVGGLIKIDMANQVAAGKTGLAETYLFSNLKHEVDSSATSTTAFGPDTVILNDMDRAHVTVLNANTIQSNPLGGGTPVTNSIVKITGTKAPYLTVIGSRMGTLVASTDYLIDDEVRGLQVSKKVRNSRFCATDRDYLVSTNATDIIESTRKLSDSTGVFDAEDMFNRDIAGTMQWGDGIDPVDNKFYRVAANRLATDGSLQARRLMARGGTALVDGDFALAAEWGDTATVTVAAGGTDQRFHFTVTCGGAGIGANPVTTLTFKEALFGAQKWVTAPMAVACMDYVDGSGAIANVAVGYPSITNVKIKYMDTPIAGKTYSFVVILMG